MGNCGRLAGEGTSIDHLSLRAGGSVLTAAEMTGITHQNRGDGMAIQDLSTTPPLVWVFSASSTAIAGAGVRVPDDAPPAGRWLANGAYSPLAWVQGGNSFGAHSAIGTNDAFDLLVETNGTTRLRLLANGNLGIGTATPGATLDVNGALIFEPVTRPDVAAGGIIGTAAQTVDLASFLIVTQTTAGQALTLPAPTDAKAGRFAWVLNGGNVPFLMYGRLVQRAEPIQVLWDGSSWWTQPSAGLAYATRSADQAAVAANTDIVWNQSVRARGVTLDTATGIFTLLAGRIYRLHAAFGIDTGGTGETTIAWVSSANAALSAQQANARAISPTSAGTIAGQPTSTVIFEAGAVLQVKTRCLATTNNATVVAATSYVDIVEIQ